jgi:hypothetical protein
MSDYRAREGDPVKIEFPPEKGKVVGQQLILHAKAGTGWPNTLIGKKEGDQVQLTGCAGSFLSAKVVQITNPDWLPANCAC